MRLLLTKKFSFEMAHALEEYDGKCANLHGHSYHLELTVDGGTPNELGADGMAMDFHKIKELVERVVVRRFDHALCLHSGSEKANLLHDMPNLIELPFNPTTENFLLHFATLIEKELPRGVRIHSLRLAETESSVAELLY